MGAHTSAHARNRLNGSSDDAASTPAEHSEESRGRWAAPAIGLLGAAVCFAWSWHPSLYSDEAVTISAAKRSLGQLRDLVSHVDAVHAAYYVVMHFWVAAFGSSPTSLRLPSALASGVAAAGVYVLGRQLASRRIGLVASVVFMILPRVTWMGVEARPFAFSAGAAVWLTIVAVYALRTSSTRSLLGYGAFAVAAVVLNVYLALLVLAHTVTVVVSSRVSSSGRRRFVVSAAASLIASSPFLLAASHQSRQLGTASISVAQWVRNVFVNNWFLGDTPTPFNGGPGAEMSSLARLWRPASLLLAAVSWALVLVVGYRWWRSRREVDTTIETAALIRWAVPWMALPVVVVAAYAFTLGTTNLASPRYFTFASPAVALLVAAGATSLASRWMRSAAILAMCALCVPIYVSQRGEFAKSSFDYSPAARYVEQRRVTGEGVYFAPLTPPTGATVTGRTTRRVEISYPQAFDGLRDVTLVRTGAQDGTFDGSSSALDMSTDRLAGLPAVWVLRYRSYPPQAVATEDRLLIRAGFRPTGTWRGPVTTVTEFVRAP